MYCESTRFFHFITEISIKRIYSLIHWSTDSNLDAFVIPAWCKTLEACSVFDVRCCLHLCIAMVLVFGKMCFIKWRIEFFPMCCTNLGFRWWCFNVVIFLFFRRVFFLAVSNRFGTFYLKWSDRDIDGFFYRRLTKSSILQVNASRRFQVLLGLLWLVFRI